MVADRKNPSRVQEETSAGEDLWICKKCLSKEGVKQQTNLIMSQSPPSLREAGSLPFFFLPCYSVLVAFLEESEKTDISQRANCKELIQGTTKQE